MSITIEGKVALVTGANRGIGKAIVESLLAHGAKKVYLAVRNIESANELVTTYADKVVPVQVDMADANAIKALPQKANDVQILINNAGILEKADLLSDDFETAFAHELNVNTNGLIRLAQAFIPVLEQFENSALVQLNSIASIKNFTDFTSYSASKAAAYAITQGLRERLAEKGIHVLSVHPGPIATDMATNAGVVEMAEPASIVSEGIVTALENGDFHLFPDTMAKQFWSQYQGYAETIIDEPVHVS